MAVYSPEMVLSKNRKCGCSLNLPIIGHCRPTRNCIICCYARSGHTSLPVSMRKQKWLSKYLEGKNISRLIEESSQWRAVRVAGTGDLKATHIPALFSLAKACPGTMFWGMTRKLEIAHELNHRYPNLKFMVSVDGSSPDSVWNYDGVLCYGPRLPRDLVPADRRIQTVFPYHRSGRVVNGMPHHPKDCQAVWHNISGCMVCGRCWAWKGA